MKLRLLLIRISDFSSEEDRTKYGDRNALVSVETVKYSAMFVGSWRVGTFTEIDGNINSQKYMDI